MSFALNIVYIISSHRWTTRQQGYHLNLAQDLVVVVFFSIDLVQVPSVANEENLLQNANNESDDTILQSDGSPSRKQQRVEDEAKFVSLWFLYLIYYAEVQILNVTLKN